MSAAQRQLARGLESVGIGSGGGGIVGLLGSLLVLRGRLGLLGHIVGLLGSGLRGIVLLLGLLLVDRGRGSRDTASGSLERGIVPALIVLAIFVVVVQTGSHRRGGVVLGLLLLDVTRLRLGRGSVGWGGRCDGQMVSTGAETAIELIDSQLSIG